MKEMGFLIISEGGDGLGLGLRLKAEGYPVSISIKDSELGKRGENLIDKGEVKDFLPVIISDCTGSGSLMDTYRESGALTFAGSQVADRLEEDRSFASGVFKECGIEEPDSKEFTSWEDAEQFIISLDSATRLVFKPNGMNSGNIPSYVSEDNEDMLRMLSQYRKQIGDSNVSFILQEFIKGTCISSEGWFSKDHFVEGMFNHTLERKQLLPGDIGPSGGCTGNVVWVCSESQECPLCKNVRALQPFLERHEYNGPIDINAVVDPKGEAYALEFTPRFGYDAFPTLLYGLFGGSFGDFIQRCSKGGAPDEVSLRPGFAAGIRISVAPWPSEQYKSREGLAIRGLGQDPFRNFYPYEVSSFEGELETSGGCGIIGVAVGYAEEIEGAFEQAYSVVDRIKLADKQYRNDLLEVFKSDLRKLRLAYDASFARSESV